MCVSSDDGITRIAISGKRSDGRKFDYNLDNSMPYDLGSPEREQHDAYRRIELDALGRQIQSDTLVEAYRSHLSRPVRQCDNSLYGKAVIDTICDNVAY